MLNPITSELLGPGRHGFFTSEGGVSGGTYASLNCGEGSSDDPAAVAENRARVAAHMGVDDVALVSVHQVHSADVIEVTDAFGDAKPKCDAMVSAMPGIALGTLSADCAPLLFRDADAGVVGAAHAGWRGALAGVGRATVEAMEGLGASRGNICAVIGPTISQRAYEVGPEFVETFVDGDREFSRFFAGGHGDRAQFDLPSFLLHQLRQVGVKSAEWTGDCTFSNPERLFSYRRNTHAGVKDYGRLIAAITI